VLLVWIHYTERGLHVSSVHGWDIEISLGHKQKTKAILLTGMSRHTLVE
jgi:hypothetical protein